MKWRDDVPLTEGDYAEIRANVMRDVGKPDRGLSLVRLAFVAVAVVLALLAIPRKPVAPPPLSVPVQRQPVITAGKLPADRPAGSRRSELVRKKRRHVAHRPEPEVQTVATRIDIQTADPDVRIIWFAR